MRLSSTVLENLEVFQNSVLVGRMNGLYILCTPRVVMYMCISFCMHLQTDRKENGTLFWILNHTRTPFGRRLLRKWISYPLRSVAEVKKRQAAVRELSSSESLCISLLKKVLIKLPDLEKVLCSAYHKKVLCSMHFHGNIFQVT